MPPKLGRWIVCPLVLVIHIPSFLLRGNGLKGEDVLKGRTVMMIHDLKRQGLSVLAIARRTGHDPKTVRKYLNAGLEAPIYGPRAPRGSVLDAYAVYIRGKLKAFPDLSAARPFREVGELGYQGSLTTVKDFVRSVRPSSPPVFERRFETAPGKQAQVDFAYFQTTFENEPEQARVVWLFSMVLGHSRYLFARFVSRQTLDAVVRCHMAAFAGFAGVPGEVLYDRMKTAVLGEDTEGRIIFNKTLLDLAGHYGFVPKACKPYRAKTKGKVERPFRYIRQDFFLGRSFRDLDDMNQQLDHWLDTVANARIHGTTNRVVCEAFADEQATLQALPAMAFNTVLKLERRITKDGMISVDGNLYSVPDGTRRRAVEVHVLADKVRIFEADTLIAEHRILAGRNQRSLLPGHRSRKQPQPTRAEHLGDDPDDAVWQRPLAIYDEAARAIADAGTAS
jgi:transposase